MKCLCCNLANTLILYCCNILFLFSVNAAVEAKEATDPKAVPEAKAEATASWDEWDNSSTGKIYFV